MKLQSIKLLSTAFTAVVAVAFAGCSSEEPANEDNGNGVKPIVLTPAESEAIKGLSGFNDKLFAGVCSSSAKDENIILSPFGASMYLSLLANAVDEKSEDEIKTALGHKDLESLNSANAKLLTGMSGRTSNIEVAIANSVWYNQELTLSDVFSNIASDHYRAELRPCELPDYNGRTVSFVNAWASEKTRGLIPEIYRALPMCESLIINALYFKGAWAQVFEKSSTAEGVFHGSMGDRKVMMMHLTETMQGIYGDGYTAVRKLFSGLQYEAIFILPDDGTEIDELINSGKLSGFAEKYTPPFEVDFKMPRFKIASDGMYDFTNVLVDMGIKTLGDFQELPMFNPIRQGRHLIGQKAIVEFDEEGAKAAAVTAGSDGAFFPEKLSVTLDRPFVFFINERTTGVCLFAGKVMNPNS